MVCQIHELSMRFFFNRVTTYSVSYEYGSTYVTYSLFLTCSIICNSEQFHSDFFDHDKVVTNLSIFSLNCKACEIRELMGYFSKPSHFSVLQ